MADANQFLRIAFQGVNFLLPGSASLAIEQRDALVTDDSDSLVTAWRPARQGRWPAFALDSTLKPLRTQQWQRAVFIEAKPQAVGLVADEIQLLNRNDIHVAPFTPLGPKSSRFGHFFNAAWVDGSVVTLIFDPLVLAAYLRSLGEAV
ncbi:MAG: hypothetical protein HY308_19140 [Gammaproteobacteria bacterium]|nr:hypothetical protein [Gammaproteobacteria bacterium]